MKKTLVVIAMLISCNMLFAQNYSDKQFVGVWYGTIESEWHYYKKNITIEFYEDGTYYDHSGILMPSIYPNTQTWEYEEETNRLHLRYLQTVYAGMRTYTHIYYEVVDFNDDILELHYNFWDDPEPNPDAQKLVLSMNATSVSENTLEKNNKELIRITDISGKVVTKNTTGKPLIYQYDDGSIEKRIIIK